ncbi:UNVERIFIED_CONTAM: hypothetical protein PYX00_003569 [Menopon gallinae]|uniref:Regucalcin n=1 Tax=Menopon gallinae TaxID=328185 RepID=A0AAW2I0G5_9NEOP
MMTNVKFEQITGPMECGEGPHWDSSRKCLYFVDINRSLVLRYVPETNEVFHAKVDGPSVSLIIPIKDTKDKFLIGVGRCIAIMTWDGVKETVTKNDLKVLYEVDEDKPNNRFNDGKTDARGRLFAGTMGAFINGAWEDARGSLFIFEANKKQRVVADGIGIANGLAWSLDYKHFYYIDSLAYRIDVFDYDLDTGEATNRRVLFDLKTNGVKGLPDGMCIDNCGNLWVALYEGGMMCLDPITKQVIHKFDLPGCHITSVAFGGENLDELYVTSAAQHMTPEERRTHPFFGCTFKIVGLGVKGLDGIPYSGE